MLAQLLYQVLDWLFGFFTLALLARFFMQWARAPFRNPLGEFVIAVTDWAVKPARRLIPGAFGWDLPSLALAWLLQLILHGLIFGLSGAASSPSGLGAAAIGWLALLAVVAILRIALYLLTGVVIIAALLSWINPYAPMAPIFNLIARPFLRPIQRFLPPIGGVDLSPMVLLLAMQILLSVLSTLQHSLIPFGIG
ncbi:MAG: YggT family protein [Betaproteobacteria bacterium]|nr:YggT family protein [Betaproteobacteria bacterium]